VLNGLKINFQHKILAKNLIFKTEKYEEKILVHPRGADADPHQDVTGTPDTGF
jgi:hypothetical protein